MVALFVDNRERHVIAELEAQKVDHTVVTLDVGDYVVRDSEGNDIAIWERKTYADLAASITDSRYREQKHRLQAAPGRYKGYIIEGICPTGKYRSLQPGAIDSVRLGLTCRDGFHLISSTGIKHTVTILRKMLKKLPEYLSAEGADEGDRYQSALVQSANSGVSAIKRENFTPETCYLAQLSQLPQVSLGTAKVIRDRYSNMGRLTTEIVADRIRTIETIGNLRGTSGRRLGESVATKVCDYLVPLPKKVSIKKRTDQVGSGTS